MLTLVALGLSIASLSTLIAVVIGCQARLRSLSRRIQSLENALGERTLPPRQSPVAEGFLQGLRVALDIAQDHPHPVLATLLKEALLKEDAVVDEAEPDVRVEGTLVCNGYADVYFRADLTVVSEGQPLFTISERPPHGDRQENLAREVVARLKEERAKRERQGALRELGR